MARTNPGDSIMCTACFTRARRVAASYDVTIPDMRRMHLQHKLLSNKRFALQQLFDIGRPRLYLT